MAKVVSKSTSKSATKNTPSNDAKSVASSNSAAPKRHRKPDQQPHSPEKLVAHQATPSFLREGSKHPALAMLTDDVALQWREKLAERKAHKQPMIENEQELWHAVGDYVEFLDRTPFIASRPGYKGEPFHNSYRPPAVISGLCAFIGISRITWHSWKDMHNTRYREDLHDTINAIETMFHSAAVGQAATGELHANFMSGLLQIAKRHEHGISNDNTTTAEEVESILNKIRGTFDPVEGKDADAEKVVIDDAAEEDASEDDANE